MCILYAFEIAGGAEMELQALHSIANSATYYRTHCDALPHHLQHLGTICIWVLDTELLAPFTAFLLLL